MDIDRRRGMLIPETTTPITMDWRCGRDVLSGLGWNRTTDTRIFKKRFELSRFYVPGCLAVRLGTKGLSGLYIDRTHRQATLSLASVSSYHAAELGTAVHNKKTG
jgi:hypothetical protein